jgi:hypothetical protein
MSTFKYQLTPDQYARFQHASNTREIQVLGKPLGVLVQDGPSPQSWTFSGKMEGGAWIDKALLLTIVVRKRPWWAFGWLLDSAFKAALK